MKRILLFVVVLAVLASCSTPQKYTYHFDHHKYQSVKKDPVASKITQELVAVEVQAQQADLQVTSGELVAASEAPVSEVKNPVLEKVGQLTAKLSRIGEATSTVEKKALRQELKQDMKTLKKDLKSYIKAKKASPDATQDTKAIDRYLKFALVFALAAIIASVIPGLWYVGGILGLVALVFLILWLVDEA